MCTVWSTPKIVPTHSTFASTAKMRAATGEKAVFHRIHMLYYDYDWVIYI